MFALLPPVVVVPWLYVNSAALFIITSPSIYNRHHIIYDDRTSRTTEHPKLCEIQTVRVKREFEKFIEIQPVPIMYHLASRFSTRQTR